jgi:uncharacterized protein
MIVSKIRDYVYNECNKSNNVFGPSFFQQHILVVAEYGKKLAQHFIADIEVIELAAYLHDISVIYDIGTIQNHNTLSAEIAKKILNQSNYPSNLIQKVEHCILSHSSPVQIENGLVEEICLSNADAISQITNPIYWLYFAFNIRKYGFEEGREWLLRRIENNWNELIKPAKELVEVKYHEAKNFLKS